MKEPPRVRWILLVLLWIWAICVFAALDLFLNLEALDRVRPRAMLYRSMRYAAHKLVGEPYRDDDFGSRQGMPVATCDAGELVRRLAVPRPVWRELAALTRASARRYTAAEREYVRTAAHAALAPATHPTADFAGGTAAVAVAAAVGDDRTWEILLRLLHARDLVVAKLPLTGERDDLVFLDLTIGAVAENGTVDQRARLRLLLAAALETEEDPETRALLGIHIQGR